MKIMTQTQARVVVVRDAASAPGEADERRIEALCAAGFRALADGSAPGDFVAALFHPGDRVGIKINTIGGRALSTRPATSLGLAAALEAGGVPARNILVWDRTGRELEAAGYRLSDAARALKIFGTDAAGAGYESELRPHRETGSRFSVLQSRWATASVSLALLKDHGLAGITGGLKNYFGAVHNPNKYHDTGCNPYVADLCDAPPIKSRHRLTILDALTVQYHRGPSYHAAWAARERTLVFGLDPVACDRVGWAIVERLRAKKGLPSLAEEGRAPAWLAAAARLGLGTDDLARIEVLDVEI